MTVTTTTTGQHPFGKIRFVSWITLRTTSFRWEAELMQQLLASHGIPTRIIDLGVMAYTGLGSPAALQVCSEHEYTALLLLSLPEDEIEAPE